MKKNNEKKIILTGGGSSGHVTPNLALIPVLRENNFSISYIGSYKGIEKDLISDLLPYYAISTGKLRRYFSLKNFFDIFRVIWGVAQSLLILLRLNPDVVFSKGGFVSCPVVWSSWILRIPVVIHESDLTTGLANKLSIPFAKRIFITFPESSASLPQKKTMLTGLPLRQSVLKGNRSRILSKYSLVATKVNLLIIGGSLGAQSINDVIHDNIISILEKYNVLHICGKGKINQKLMNLEGYIQFDYVSDELGDLYSAADIIISRAGSTVINEIISNEKLNILIPLSKKSSRGDQILNANSFKKNGLSLVIEDEKFSKETLFQNLDKLQKEKAHFYSNLQRSNSVSPQEIIIEELKKIVS